MGWVVFCLALAAFTDPAQAGVASTARSAAFPCPTAIAGAAAPTRALVKRKAAANPSFIKPLAVGVPRQATRKFNPPRVQPRPALRTAPVPLPQDGCTPASVLAPPALNTLITGAAPAVVLPHSALPPFAVPLDAVPAIIDGVPDTGAPVLLYAVPAIDDAAGAGARMWAPSMPFPWTPATFIGGRPSYPAPLTEEVRPALPIFADVPRETDREIGLPVPLSGEPHLVPTAPSIPDANIPAEVPEPASVVLMLSGLLAVWAQAARKRRQARSRL